MIWHFKPTLDNESIRLLQTKEQIIKYFQFFEEFYDKAQPYLNENFAYSLSIPNTACPSPHTKEDGLLFANLCKLCREIEKENIHLRYFKHICPFNPRHKDYLHQKNISYNSSGGMCGSGKFVVGLLPYNMISACHNGFCDLISDYKAESQKNINNFMSNTALDFKFFASDKDIRLTQTIEEFQEYERIVEGFFKPNSKAIIGNSAALINMLARVGQVDKKYIDREQALRAAYFIQEAGSFCLRDNINTTGCIDLQPVGLFKLLLNGAREYIENE